MADVRLTATNPEDSSVVPVACNEKGELKLEEPLVVEGPPGQKGDKGDPGDPFSGHFDGDVTFSESLTLGGTGTWIKYVSSDQSGSHNSNWLTCGVLRVEVPSTFPIPESWLTFSISDHEGRRVINLWGDGQATFASNKAGFTAAGSLWCTTDRGDTIRLVGSSNGMAVWENYTPPNSLSQLQDRWAEKNGIRPMPEESSQDEPETKQ